jgi:nucleoid-associated protein YgaU
LGAKEDVKITFSPDQQSPVTESIDFVQTAKSPGSDQPGNWARLHPKEKLKGGSATTAGSNIHQTRQGETLASVSQQHFGTADKAEKIFQENFGRLVWWSAQSDAQPNDRSTRPLPAGVLLRIPDAVQGGFMMDIRPDDVLPRSKRTDPNISPNYPAQGEMTTMPGGYLGRINGFKRADGSKHDASMTDLPGGGPDSGRFEFESAAFAKDIGLIYGAIKWGFMYSSNGITDEKASLVLTVSDTFNVAMASFNRVYKNKHIVQQGETLNSIAILYYGSTEDAHRIYLMNRTNPDLPAYDPAVAIAGGTELEVGLGPSVWDEAKSNKE